MIRACTPHYFAALPPPVGVDPIPWGTIRELRTLRVNLAFATEDDAEGTAPAGQHLLWLERMLKRMPPALEEVVLQDYTDYWDYFTDDVYVSAWTRIVALLGNRTRFPRFCTFVVDSKRSVTEKIRQQVLMQQPQTLPFDVRLGPGKLACSSFVSKCLGLISAQVSCRANSAVRFSKRFLEETGKLPTFKRASIKYKTCISICSEFKSKFYTVHAISRFPSLKNKCT